MVSIVVLRNEVQNGVQKLAEFRSMAFFKEISVFRCGSKRVQDRGTKRFSLSYLDVS